MHTLIAMAMPSLALRSPPTLDNDLLAALPFKADWGTDARVYQMPCPDCRVGPNTLLQDLPIDPPRPGETFPESVLRVNISVVKTNLDDLLKINACTFYPSPGDSCTSIFADQYVKPPCGPLEYKATPDTAFRITREHTNDNVLGRGIALNVLKMWIGRVATRLISPEPLLEVKMLIFPNGQLLIATDPSSNPSEPPPASTCAAQSHGPTSAVGGSSSAPPTEAPSSSNTPAQSSATIVGTASTTATASPPAVVGNGAAALGISALGAVGCAIFGAVLSL